MCTLSPVRREIVIPRNLQSIMSLVRKGIARTTPLNLYDFVSSCPELPAEPLTGRIRRLRRRRHGFGEAERNIPTIESIRDVPNTVHRFTQYLEVSIPARVCYQMLRKAGKSIDSETAEELKQDALALHAGLITTLTEVTNQAERRHHALLQAIVGRSVENVFSNDAFSVLHKTVQAPYTTSLHYMASLSHIFSLPDADPADVRIITCDGEVLEEGYEFVCPRVLGMVLRRRLVSYLRTMRDRNCTPSKQTSPHARLSRVLIEDMIRESIEATPRMLDESICRLMSEADVLSGASTITDEFPVLLSIDLPIPKSPRGTRPAAVLTPSTTSPTVRLRSGPLTRFTVRQDATNTSPFSVKSFPAMPEPRSTPPGRTPTLYPSRTGLKPASTKMLTSQLIHDPREITTIVFHNRPLRPRDLISEDGLSLRCNSLNQGVRRDPITSPAPASSRQGSPHRSPRRGGSPSKSSHSPIQRAQLRDKDGCELYIATLDDTVQQYLGECRTYIIGLVLSTVWPDDERATKCKVAMEYTSWLVDLPFRDSVRTSGVLTRRSLARRRVRRIHALKTLRIHAIERDLFWIRHESAPILNRLKLLGEEVEKFRYSMIPFTSRVQTGLFAPRVSDHYSLLQDVAKLCPECTDLDDIFTSQDVLDGSAWLNIAVVLLTPITISESWDECRLFSNRTRSEFADRIPPSELVHLEEIGADTGAESFPRTSVILRLRVCDEGAPIRPSASRGSAQYTRSRQFDLVFDPETDINEAGLPTLGYMLDHLECCGSLFQRLPYYHEHSKGIASPILSRSMVHQPVYAADTSQGHVATFMLCYTPIYRTLIMLMEWFDTIRVIALGYRLKAADVLQNATPERLIHLGERIYAEHEVRYTEYLLCEVFTPVLVTALKALERETMAMIDVVRIVSYGYADILEASNKYIHVDCKEELEHFMEACQRAVERVFRTAGTISGAVTGNVLIELTGKCETAMRACLECIKEVWGNISASIDQVIKFSKEPTIPRYVLKRLESVVGTQQEFWRQLLIARSMDDNGYTRLLRERYDDLEA
ncbi:hypothetical protein GMRT_14353 [Giardia muris]|uniref:Uncharacterized protein n=1 Tax=Giardia muris TaxID=5742 RepID=A0A4Z1T6T7_GIAMU|nr:hypothetical protein GMRT_14353 [Giardia muris]|eukprot:TNJ28201.1 hypothetical protein GMRT_14353 [Giardia muris]